MDEFDLSDDATRVREIIASARDRSSVSEEIEDAATDWPMEFALSAKRANLLRAFDLDGLRRVLEIGCGCGAITRFMGDRGIAVDAIERSPVKAEIAALRCQGLAHVSIRCADPERFEPEAGAYDAILLVGFTGTKAEGESDLTGACRRASEMLRRLSYGLRPGGVMLVASDNRCGLKYALGAHEERHARRYAGTHGYRDLSGPCVFSRAEWETVLHDGGLTSLERYLLFPDWRVPTVLLSENFAQTDPYAYCHLEGLLSRDYCELLVLDRDENYFWEAVQEAGALPALANSFCIVAAPAVRSPHSLGSWDFAHLPSFSRKLKYSAVTRKRRGRDIVEKLPLVEPCVWEDVKTGDVQHRLGAEPYLPGPLLSSEWARALAADGTAAFEEELRKYLRFLDVEGGKDAGGLRIDAVPINIIVGADGAYRLFDQEWECREPVGKELLLFRALLLFAVRYPWTLRRIAGEWGVYDVRGYVEYAFRFSGLDFLGSAHTLLLEEEAFQNEIMRRRSGGGTEEFLRKPLLRHSEPPGMVGLRCLRSGEVIATPLLSAPDEEGCVKWEGALSYAYANMDRVELVFMPDDVRPMRRIVYVDWVSLDFIDAGGELTKRVRLDSSAAVQRDALLLDLEYVPSESGGYFVTTGPRPAVVLILDLTSVAHSVALIRMQVICRLPRSIEYVQIRDRYLALERQVAERLRQVELRLYRYQLWKKFLSNKGHILRFLQSFRKSVHSLTDEGLSAWYMAALKKIKKSASNPYELWARKKRLWRTPASLTTDVPSISVIWYAKAMPIGKLLVGAYTLMAKGIPPHELWLIGRELSTIEHAVLKLLVGKRLRVLEHSWTDVDANHVDGEYLAFLESGDRLAPWTLDWVRRALNEREYDFLYTDEDRMLADGQLDEPHFKGDYSPDLSMSGDYFGGLIVIRRELFRRLGGFRPNFDRARLYDLALRASEVTNRIAHLARPLYHRLARTAAEQDACHREMRRALEEALVRRNIEGTVEDGRGPCRFRVRRRLQMRSLVSIVLIFRDHPESLRACVASILEKSSYDRFEIVGISHHSTMPATREAMRVLMRMDPRVRFVECNAGLNSSPLWNFGMSQAAGDMLVLLGQGLEILDPDWIESLLEHAQRPEVGAVGGKLYFPDDTVAQAGIAVGLRGAVGFPHRGCGRDAEGYFGRLHAIQNVSAVSADMMMVRREVWTAASGFDERRFPSAFYDVDFCLRLRQRGLLNVFTPYAQARFLEFPCPPEENIMRLRHYLRDRENFLQRYRAMVESGDPYYNPNLDRNREDFAWAP